VAVIRMEQAARSAPEAAGVADFAAVVGEYKSLVFSIAVHYLGDRPTAEEVAQDVFLRLFREPARWVSREHLTAWLRRVACNRALDYGRRRRFEPKYTLDDVGERAAPAKEQDPLLSEALQKLVRSLPEKARAVVILRFQEELELEEIAETLEMPLGTVKSHLQRSLALLREKLGRLPGEGVR